MSKTYKYYQLTNGQDIITEVNADGTLNEPAVIVPVPGPKGETSMQLMPFGMFAADKKAIKMKLEHVVIECEPELTILEHYKTVTGKTKIITKPQGIILPS